MSTPTLSIYQFKVTLEGTTGGENKPGVPSIWRRILIPANYNFRDLHVAIQSSMGWAGVHLHRYKIVNPTTGKLEIIGTSNETGYEDMILEYAANIAQYFVSPQSSAIYEYDFKDKWIHQIVLESIFPAVDGVKYPQCIEGERACPPEDSGGMYGYETLLKILADPDHPEHAEHMEWLTMCGYEDYDPEYFDPLSVYFDFFLMY